MLYNKGIKNKKRMNRDFHALNFTVASKTIVVILFFKAGQDINNGVIKHCCLII
ncbi:hypothetical protein GCM10007424_26110 [Flavobacterium suaedae]|uniref:Uncharacterized protein n=1 Tax=Flavobacterium suaedae TaxID=1767027 RepID=A0ABQ1K4L2_9FLAO|nr:hypothetical protein GCM10007424_26110 [Flavobacterium suaedae]